MCDRMGVEVDEIRRTTGTGLRTKAGQHVTAAAVINAIPDVVAAPPGVFTRQSSRRSSGGKRLPAQPSRQRRRHAQTAVHQV